MIVVRNARKDDVPQLVEIGMRAWAQAATGVADLDALRDHARNAFLSFLSRHWLTVTVAEKAGVVAGWAAREALDDQITDLWVEPAQQRQGVGAALLAAVEAEVREADFESAGLQTHARNTVALAFFGKHGYSVHWLSVAYSSRLDRDVESVGLSRQLVVDEPIGYGPGGF
jgi:ribosomal-protein-alanine N-acetyltransferase